jgi:hypothetical protein
MAIATKTAEELYASLPAWLRDEKRFLLWKKDAPLGDAAKKPRKVPHYADGGPRRDLDTEADRARLVTLAQALDALRAAPRKWAGVGFALGPDGEGGYWQGIDLDDLASNPHLAKASESLKGYVERSPSGNGIHAIGHGQHFQPFGSDGSGVEAYARGRFFTITGNAVRDNGKQDLRDDVAFLAQFRKTKRAVSAQPAANTEAWENYFELTPERLRDLRAALAYLDSDPREEWIAVGMAMKGGGDEAFEVWNEWSARSAKYAAEDARQTWSSFSPTKTGLGAVFKKAERAGWINPRRQGRDDRDISVKAANDDACDQFPFESAGALVKNVKAPQYLIDGLIEGGALGMLFGDPGAGKSFLAIDWACSVATGAPWLGRAVDQGPVFYIAGEGHSGMGRRLLAWQTEHEPSLADAPLYISRIPASLMDAENALRVAAAARALAEGVRPKLVVIDTFHRNLGSGDENSAEDVAAFLSNVDIFIRKEFDCAVLIVHHSGHSDKSRARGSSSIIGAMDFILQLTENGGLLELRGTKQKDGEIEKPIPLVLKPVELTFATEGSTGSSLVVVQGSKRSTLEQLEELPEWKALHRAVESCPVNHPQIAGVPETATATTEEAWRENYEALRADDPVQPGSVRRAFSRKKKALIDDGHVGQSEEWVWPITDF